MAKGKKTATPETVQCVDCGQVAEIETAHMIHNEPHCPVCSLQERISGPDRIKTVVVVGRRWFQKSYGNTYHTATIILDGVTVHKTAMEYGYGDQYVETACQWLENNSYIPKREYKQGGMGGYKDAPYRHLENLGIKLNYHAVDVPREKDL